MGSTKETVAVVGLGYVGLPVALAFGRKFRTIGFDIKQRRIEDLKRGVDETREVASDVLRASKVEFTCDAKALAAATFYIVAVPTPIDEDNHPDLRPLVEASKTVAPHLKRGDIVVYESTVYPGVTEDVCGPLLQQLSGLKCGVDFFLGYSPERINPGDTEHTFERIVKVVSGQDAASLERVAAMYGAVVDAGVHKAQSIKVAEAAKVIENTQRDLNIALMNELAFIFGRMGIRTKDVLDAASTKWNFLRFSPGLVGGHCIGVDPYYLTAKAQQLGYQPQVILAGRRINNGVGPHIARRVVKMLATRDTPLSQSKVAIAGLTFKENVSDLRNSKVPDIVNELKSFGIQALVHDPLADKDEAKHEYGIELCDLTQMQNLDALIVAVAHDTYVRDGISALLSRVKTAGVFADVKSLFTAGQMERGIAYWSL